VSVNIDHQAEISYTRLCKLSHQWAFHYLLFVGITELRVEAAVGLSYDGGKGRNHCRGGGKRQTSLQDCGKSVLFTFDSGSDEFIELLN
jgi:hypothetical protein